MQTNTTEDRNGAALSVGDTVRGANGYGEVALIAKHPGGPGVVVQWKRDCVGATACYTDDIVKVAA